MTTVADKMNQAQQQFSTEMALLAASVEAEYQNRGIGEIVFDILYEAAIWSAGAAILTYTFTAVPVTSAVIYATILSVTYDITQLALTKLLDISPVTYKATIPAEILTYIALRNLAPLALAYVGLPALGLGFWGIVGCSFVGQIAASLIHVPAKAALETINVTPTSPRVPVSKVASLTMDWVKNTIEIQKEELESLKTTK